MNSPSTYISTISSLPLLVQEALIQEALIQEAPHVRFSGTVPSSLSFLEAHFVDLGFENLGISHQEQKTIGKGYVGRGVVLPNTGYKFRFTGGLKVIVEPLEPDDDKALPSMPEDWAEAVLTLDSNYDPVYVGSKVRSDQL